MAPRVKLTAQEQDDRDLDVLRALAAGKTYRQICAEISVSQRVIAALRAALPPEEETEQ